MDYTTFIEKFHELIIDRSVDKKHWAKELSDVLNISTDAIYKKARMESKYSIEELLLLCSKFNISLDQIIQPGNSENIIFKTPFLNKKIHDPKDYLLAIENSLKDLENITNPKILYTTRELPVFFHFIHPVLTSFKLYVFSKYVWEIPAFKESSYNHAMFDDDIFKISSQLWTTYSKFKSEEYWTIQVLDMTIHQILFLKNCGFISDSNISLIKSAILELLNMCSSMAESNSKNSLNTKGNFYLYENRILHTGNHIMVNSENKEFMYITFDNPNFIYTEDYSFVEYSKQWYEKIRRNSYFIGEGTGHLRFQFFEQLRQRLNVI